MKGGDFDWDDIWTFVWRGTLGVFVLLCLMYGLGVVELEPYKRSMAVSVH